MTDGSNIPTPPRPLSLPEIEAFLDYAHSDLLRRRDELLGTLRTMVENIARIDDDETLAAVSENMALVDRLRQRSELARKTAKEPFLEGGREVDAWFKALLQVPKELMDALQRRCDDYTQRKVAAAAQARLAEAKRLQAEAEMRVAEAAAAMKARGVRPGDVGNALDVAAEAAEKAAAATEAADAKPAEMARVYSDRGVTVSVRREWKWRLVDIRQVPPEYLLLDEGRIRMAARERDRATGRPVVQIPGIEWFPIDTTIRR